MKKVLIPILILMVLVGVTSCVSEPIITTIEIPITTTVTTTLPVVTTTMTVLALEVIDPSNGNTYIVKHGDVGIGNADTTVMYVVGQTANGTVFIMNGTDDQKTFSIKAKPYFGSSWTPAPNNIQDWVNLNNSPTNVPIQVVVPPMGVKAVAVALTVPSETILPQSWAFIISVIEYPRVIATQGFIELSYGITGSQADFSWALIPLPPPNISGIGGTVNTSGFPSKVMVRAKEGNYPANPLDISMTPTDGRLIYYGDGYDVTTATDTQATPFTFYRLWVQRVDGTWYTNSGVSSLVENTSLWKINMR